ncbi:MAG TPA: hypothetical protein VIT44_09190 [Cyclobacteriaceae bacterium]
MRNSGSVIEDINQFEPQDGNWLRLDSLLEELWGTGEQENFLTELLNIFERYPEEDGNGVLWSIVHGVEGFKSYEKELVDSLKRQPSEMGLVMLRRIKNSGTLIINGVEIDKFIPDLLLNKQLTSSLKGTLMKILQPINQ